MLYASVALKKCGLYRYLLDSANANVLTEARVGILSSNFKTTLSYESHIQQYENKPITSEFRAPSGI